jgi:hypothetical protein
MPVAKLVAIDPLSVPAEFVYVEAEPFGISHANIVVCPKLFTTKIIENKKVNNSVLVNTVINFKEVVFFFISII